MDPITRLEGFIDEFGAALSDLQPITRLEGFIRRAVQRVNPRLTPEVTDSDNGKVLTVVNGDWAPAAAAGGAAIYGPYLAEFQNESVAGGGSERQLEPIRIGYWDDDGETFRAVYMPSYEEWPTRAQAAHFYLSDFVLDNASDTLHLRGFRFVTGSTLSGYGDMLYMVVANTASASVTPYGHVTFYSSVELQRQNA